MCGPRRPLSSRKGWLSTGPSVVHSATLEQRWDKAIARAESLLPLPDIGLREGPEALTACKG